MNKFGFTIIIFLLTLGTSIQAQDSTNAQVWLTKTINEYFAGGSIHYKSITTEKYAEYKQDALGLVYGPGDMSEEQFEKKWGDIYDTSYAGIGESFLTGQQDNGKVVMSKCELTSQPESGTFIFDTEVEDTMFELTYSIEITVKRTQDGFKIDDVKKEK